MKNTLLCILSVLPLIFIQVAHNKRHGQTALKNVGIIGGKNTTIEQHPYQVAISARNNYVCCGSIISPRFVLTTGTCLVLLHRHPFLQVRVGSNHYGSGGTVYKVSKRMRHVHPKFDWDSIDYDVGVMELETSIPLDGKTMKAINLPPLRGAPVPAGTNITLTGWGVTIFPTKNITYSKHLMEITILTITHEVCAKKFEKFQFTPRMMCAGVPDGGKSACVGDNGDPAVDMSRGVQLGISSWGIGCGGPGTADVFTNLTNPDIRSWIKNMTGI